MVLRLIRDNTLVNVIGRTIVRLLLKVTARAQSLADKYRIYGIVKLSVEDVSFKVLSKADDFIANDLYYGVNYETAEFRLVKVITKNADYFIDVGANTGIFTVFAAKINPSLTIVAFEPHPGNFKRLTTNIDLNESKIISEQLSVGSTESTIQFTVPSDDSLTTISSVNDAFARNFSPIPFKTINVQQVTLDKFLEQYLMTSRDLIKIDVEYYEWEVLKGAVKILSSVKPLILMEVLNYDQLIAQFPQMKDLLRKDHAQQIEMLMNANGYFPYVVLLEGVKLTDSILNHRENRNFLFAPVRVPKPLIPYNQLADTFLSSR